MKQECIQEIEELHQFFQAWFNGDIDQTTSQYARFTDVLHADFSIISPNGMKTSRTQLTGSLYMMHGKRPDLKIWIEKPEFRLLSNATAMLTYEEWQQDNETATPQGRISTAIFETYLSLPNSVSWLYVHETALQTATAQATDINTLNEDSFNSPKRNEYYS